MNVDELIELVDDLCVINSGWQTEDQHRVYLQALNRIARHGHKVYGRHEIERLKARIKELEKQ